MNRAIAFIVLPLTIWSSFSEKLLSAPVVDQVQPLVDGAGNYRAGWDLDGAHEVAQMIRAGVTGKLTGVELLANTMGDFRANLPLYAEIRRADSSGFPAQDIVGTSFPVRPTLNFTPEYFTLDFSNVDVQVTAGEVFALVVWSDYSPGFRIKGAYGNPYGSPAYSRLIFGGRGFGESGSYWSPTFQSYNVTFRTFVEPVPEPTSLLMVLVAGIFYHRATRRSPC